ncbi:MAG TPA: methyltransferase domain-containing protein [Bacteroidota bacterium]|nr:methyltransferase domain-containing protein [Bacteroidota bacterium]
MAPEIDKSARWFSRYPSVVRIDEQQSVTLTDRQKIAYRWAPKTGAIADIGSSSGPLGRALCKNGRSVVAVDLDLFSLSQVKKGPVEYAGASASRLPFRDASFDTVLLLDVLEHVDDERGTLAEAHRILRDGGTMILSVPNKGFFAFLDPQNLASRFKAKGEPYHRHYSEGDLLALFGSNFRVVRKHTGGLFLYPVTFYLAHFFKKYFHLDWRRFFALIGDFDNDISWGRFSYNIIVLLEKC